MKEYDLDFRNVFVRVDLDEMNKWGKFASSNKTDPV